MLDDFFDDAARRDWEDAEAATAGEPHRTAGSTQPTGTVRLALVGCGGYARTVSLPAMQAADYAEPTVVVSGDADKRRRLADEHGVTAIGYDEYGDGAATDEYDAVYVATPNRLHLPQVETAAAHGKHVICEKPLEATVDRAERLVEACDAAGVTLMTAYRVQTDPVTRRLREFVRAGGIGDPVRAFGEFSFSLLGGDSGPDQWRLDDELAGGGALYDVGVYPLNTARFLLDDDPVAVSGSTRSSGDAFADVDEHVDFTVDFGDAVGHFAASYSGRQHAHLSIHGSDGRLTVRSAYQPNAAREVELDTADGHVEFSGVGVDDAREEFDYFAHAVLTGAAVEPDGADGLVDMRTMAGVYESDETGRTVEL
ncbi:D-xylose 1-dehydrogenase Gfo6 [Halobaculum sp. D14]|uniref:D-xylose 1-dehydrogenase Gfo6 n=1 Tax=Halobaculum sp. D14 TaxID=3421642 RepID=UPI003EC01BB4